MKNHDVDNSFCVSVAAHMRALLAKRDFVGAVECYEANRSQINTKVGGSEAGEFLHLAAQAYASLTDYPAALKVARTAQALVTAGGDSLLLAEVFVTLGGILRVTQTGNLQTYALMAMIGLALILLLLLRNF